MRRGPAVTVVAFTVVLLGACSTQGSPTKSIATAAPPGSAESSSSRAVQVDGTPWEHLHNLAFDGDALLLGTHQGLFRQQAGRQPELISATPFDVMGLAHDGRRWLASGHPAPGDDLPADLGLRESKDGRDWTMISLSGEVDFHRLAAAGDTVMGIAADGGALLRSTDAGSTWTQVANPQAFDVAVDPARPDRVLVTTQNGPRLSTDGGASWRSLTGVPRIAFVTWTPSGLLGVSPDGAVHASNDAGATWTTRGSTGRQPSALAVDGDRVAVAVGTTVVESLDGGRTFASRLDGLGN